MKTTILFGCSIALFFILSFVALSIAKEQLVLVEWPQLVISFGYLSFGVLAYLLIRNNIVGKLLVISPVAIFLFFVLYQYGHQIITKRHVTTVVSSTKIQSYQHEAIFLDGTSKLIGLKITLNVIFNEDLDVTLSPPIFFAESELPSRSEIYSSLNKQVLRDVSTISDRVNGVVELTYYLYPSPITKYRPVTGDLNGISEICLKADTNLGFIGKPNHIDFKAYHSGTVVNLGDRLMKFLTTINTDFSEIEKLEKASLEELESKLVYCLN